MRRRSVSPSSRFAPCASARGSAMIRRYNREAKPKLRSERRGPRTQPTDRLPPVEAPLDRNQQLLELFEHLDDVGGALDDTAGKSDRPPPAIDRKDPQEPGPVAHGRVCAVPGLVGFPRQRNGVTRVRSGRFAPKSRVI